MTPTDSENRLACVFDHVEYSSQRFRRVIVPGVALSAQNDVGGTKTTDPFERNAVKWFGEDFEAGNQSTQHRAQLARARTLTIDRVVYQVNEQSYFKQ